MPKKLHYPFMEGNPGKIFVRCFAEPKTGYQIAKEISSEEDIRMRENIPYRDADKYPEVFERVEGNKIRGKAGPIVEYIVKETENSLFTQEETKILEDFFDSHLRDAYSKVKNPSLDKHPLDLFTISIILKMLYNQIEKSPDLKTPEERDFLEKISPFLSLQYITEEEALFKAYDLLNLFPNSIFEKLRSLPLINTMTQAFEGGFTLTRSLKKEED